MSSLIPFDVQREIIKYLPVISLIRFRSVCKTWKSFIQSSKFISGYRFHLHPPQLLIQYCEESEVKYVSFVDDDTFPQQKFTHTLPPLVQQLNRLTIIGSSHGLLCLFGYLNQTEVSQEIGMAVVWNPAIRKSIAIDLPTGVHDWFRYVVGFGVCPKTRDPKLLKITNTVGVEDISFQQVEVFSLSSREWRIPCSNLFPRKSIVFRRSQASIGQCIYWLAYEMIDKEHGLVECSNMIISFEMCTEEFKEVHLPDYLNDMDRTHLSMCGLWGSLVVLNYNRDAIVKQVCDVWMMEDNDPKTFTKLFAIMKPNYDIRWVFGFRNSGEPIMVTKDNFSAWSRVVVHKPWLEHIKVLGIYGYSFSFNNFDNESLLLLDHDDDYVAK